MFATNEADMSTRSTNRLVREGELVAEVAVKLVDAEGGWAPDLSLDDAYKLDDVREALRTGDIDGASQWVHARLSPDASGVNRAATEPASTRMEPARPWR